MHPTSVKVRDADSAQRVSRKTSTTVIGDAAEKDETELQLEKLLFGDEAGFLRGLEARSAEQQLAGPRELDGSENEELDDIADESVCAILLFVSQIGCLANDFC